MKIKYKDCVIKQIKLELWLWWVYFLALWQNIRQVYHYTII